MIHPTVVHVLPPVVYDGDDVGWSIGSSDSGRETVAPLICKNDSVKL